METVNGTNYLPNTSYPASDKTTIDCSSTLLDSVSVKVIKTAAYSILLLLSLVGNSLVPAVVYKNRELHTSVNYIIVSLSISDLLIPIFTLPERIKQIYVRPEIWQIEGPLGSLLCKLTGFATDISITVTVLSLMIVSFERFFAVVYPFKRQPLRSKKSCFIIIAFTWIIAILYSSQNFYTWRLETKNGTTYCFRSWKPAFDNVEAIKIETIADAVCFYLIPFLTTASFYSAIIFSLRSKKSPQNLGSNQRSRIEKENRRVTFMLLMVLLVFFVPLSAYVIFGFVTAFVGIATNTCKTRHVSFVLIYLGYSYQAFNPYIYFVFHPRYRKGVKQLLRCKCHGDPYNERNKKHQRLQLSRAASLSHVINYDVTAISMQSLQTNNNQNI